MDDLRRLDAIRAELDQGNVGRLTIADIRFLLDRLAAAESQREALDVDDLALALELVAPIDWASFGEYLRFTEEAKKSAYRQIAERLVAKHAALKEQPRCPHGNGLSCRECQYEAEAEDATWD